MRADRSSAEHGHATSLFAGSDGGARHWAMVASLVATAKLNEVEPQAWLTDVLNRIADHEITRIDELLPWRYAAAAASRTRR